MLRFVILSKLVDLNAVAVGRVQSWLSRMLATFQMLTTFHYNWRTIAIGVESACSGYPDAQFGVVKGVVHRIPVPLEARDMQLVAGIEGSDRAVRNSSMADCMLAQT